MSGSLIDANVLIDIATANPAWIEWSQQSLRDAARRGPVFINPIIYAEVAPCFADAMALDAWMDRGLFTRTALPYAAAWRAAEAFARYRKGGGNRTSPLPDFYIGAHATIEELTLVTRDVTRYRTYFPDVELVTP